MLAVLLFAGGTYALSQTLVVTALPLLAEHFDASPAATSWTLTAFLLSGAACIPIVARLGDVYGKRRTLTIVMLVYCVGAAINTVAESLPPLIVGRVLQGTAAGLFPLGFGIVRESFPRERVAGGLGAISAVFGVGAGIGLPLSGLVIDHLSITWLFGIGLLGVPAAAATALLLPESPRAPRQPIDWLGAVLLATSIGSVLLAVTQGNRWGWASAPTVAALATGAVLAAVLVRHTARTRVPLLDLGMLRDRRVAIANLTIFLVGASMFIAFVLNPQLALTDPAAGFGFGTTPTVAGLLLLSTALSQLVVGPLAGQIGARIGFRALMLGGTVLLVAAGAWMVVLHGHEWDLVIGGLLLGTGIACASAAAANVLADAVPPAQFGVATGMNTVLRTAGGAFGAAIATACLTGRTSADGVAPAEGAFTLGFAIAAVIGAAAFVAAWRLPPDGGVRRPPASPRRGSSAGARRSRRSSDTPA